MHNNNLNTAILIFSRTAKEEAEVKSFHKLAGKKLNQLIARYFINSTQKKANKTGLPVFMHYSDKQVGKTFGERLTHSIEQVFTDGYDNVIVLGNDCVDLCHKTILKAASELQRTGFAFGPDERGGAYLIGISKQYFCKQTLLSVSWNTNKVYTELLAYADAHSSAPCAELDVKADVNSQGDLEAELPNLNKDLQQIYFIFNELAGGYYYQKLDYISANVNSSRSLRAPPL